MTQREIKKITLTVLTVAAALILAVVLGGCGRPGFPADHSANLPLVQPPAVSAPAEAPSVPENPTPVVPPAEQPVEKSPEVPVEKPAVQPPPSAETLLTKAQAETVALNHAGLTAAQVKGLRSGFDIDDGAKEWDVEFYCDGWEYDYEIDAVSGAVRAFERERD